MKLSNTLMMNDTLLPSNKKAFTLAEVLITLSILGVVAALTIPTLINRQSDLAAQTKLKKAITNYENVAGAYMAETGEANAAGMVGANCANLKNYFKIVTNNGCTITTPDGVVWYFDTNGNVTVADSNSAPRYAVSMWAAKGVVNGTNDGDGNAITLPAYPPEVDTTNGKQAPVYGYFNSSFAQFKSSAYNSSNKFETPQSAMRGVGSGGGSGSGSLRRQS